MSGAYGEDDKYIYKLEICQQPQRARMCGLGDKDRRQISPPPCIQLIIIDKATNQEIPPEKVPNAACYMLIAELWDPKGTKNLSIVDTLQESQPNGNGDGNNNEEDDDEYLVTGTVQRPPYNETTYQAADPNSANSLESVTLVNKLDDPAPTRNLIGNNVTNAFKLYDEHNKLGIWFVLQDLSIRIEGKFKLRFSLFKLDPTTIFDSIDNKPEIDLNSAGSTVPILDFKYTDVFQVYSAKKFPGVMDSTPLSKAFASQGVKIPIRRDKKGGN
ncbi:hypothetical protein DASC09_046630 [Saccharomycopsis crataegensis]|uniref:Velvet domain-containing protein n=1 Tax=Saccharomycopsis crataegensis TaxID=43959 RepID=A0AAV5QQY9_9ASCO|nr:hypothetical protein DASC09_046630 [Saccharomycopsis crataegensis]